MSEKGKSKPDYEEKYMKNWDWEANMKNWRAWGSWFSWGSPVGLGIFFVLCAGAIWILANL